MNSTGIRVADIIDVMEQVAPTGLAEPWDNCGLQVGSPDQRVNKVWVALDPLLPIIDAAADQGVDMVVSHHPLIFEALKQVHLETDVGRVIEAAIKKGVTIYSAHTNLDSALEGINDVLAQIVGLEDLQPLVPASGLVSAAYDNDSSLKPGLGRIGALPGPVSLSDLAGQLKQRLNIQQVKVAGDTDLTVHKVAVCSGSGAGLMDAFLETDAEVYVSGDLKYHQARVAESAGRALIDVGHFASEHIILKVLAEKLQEAMQSRGWSVTVEACQSEQDPFVQV